MQGKRAGVVAAAVLLVACSGSDEQAEPLIAVASTTARFQVEATEPVDADEPLVGESSDDASGDATVAPAPTVPQGDPSEGGDASDGADAAVPASVAEPPDDPQPTSTGSPETPSSNPTGTAPPTDASPGSTGVAPSSSDGGGSQGTTAGGGGGSQSATGAVVTGQTVSGPDLIPTELAAAMCGASLDIPCLPATNGHDPTEAVSMGEYQRNIVVPDGAILDVYFDQSRSREEMEAFCDEMGGVLHLRSDGSRWDGWWYCADVPYG